MKLKKNFILAITIAIICLIVSCEKTTESENNWGNSDFTSFVAIGNSLTAGVSDGALFKDAQKNSFPNLIAKMADVNRDFEQPIMNGNGFSFKEEDGRFSISWKPVTIDILPAGSEDNRDLNRAYNNLGIPLIRAEQIYTATMPNEAAGNHFVDKILRNSGRTVIQEALTLNPTIMTLWVGNNDILETAALGFGDANYSYTMPNDFKTHFNNIITELTVDNDAPIFVANILDITDLPYFTSLPSSVNIGGNRTYLYGHCEDGIRQLTDDDLVLFWALPDYYDFQLNQKSNSIATALNDTVILDSEEKAEVIVIINQYNIIIRDIVDANSQLHLVDIYSLFKDIAANGYEISGVEYSKDLIYFDSEGKLNANLVFRLFGYDALHPNSFGYAAIANSFIDEINSVLDANLPLVSGTDL